MSGIENYIWCEKYRPKTLEDLVLSEETRDAFDKFISDDEIPHLLLHGSPGSGKTSIAMILMNSIPCKSLTLNASSKDRGIETVRTTIADFAKSKTTDGRLKIILLDESDGLTADAQFGLKNLMETYSSSCRFILTANVVGKIIDPIRSRCIQFGFSQFPVSDMVKNVCNILKQEEIKFDRRQVSVVVHRLYPDFRSIINAVQAASISGEFKLSAAGGTNLKMSEFADNITKGDLRRIRESFIGIQDFSFIYKFLFNSFMYDNVDDDLKPEVAQTIAQHLSQDQQIVDREINMCSCLIAIMLLLNTKIKF